MTRYSIAARASAEIQTAAAAYEGARPGLGKAFIGEIDRTLARLCEFPDIAPPVGKTFRRAVVFRFPYCILYRVKGSRIEVATVLPTAADPRRLRERILASVPVH